MRHMPPLKQPVCASGAIYMTDGVIRYFLQAGSQDPSTGEFIKRRYLRRGASNLHPLIYSMSTKYQVTLPHIT
jgi:hypothetical protein